MTDGRNVLALVGFRLINSVPTSFHEVGQKLMSNLAPYKVKKSEQKKQQNNGRQICALGFLQTEAYMCACALLCCA